MVLPIGLTTAGPRGLAGFYPVSTIALLIFIRLSEKTDRPTQHFIPSIPLYLLRFIPCLRFSTLMRPSQPTLHRWPALNHLCRRLLCSSADFPFLFGMQTFLTPASAAAVMLSALKKPAS